MTGAALVIDALPLAISLVSESGIAMQLSTPEGVPPFVGTTVIDVAVLRVIVGNTKLPGVVSAVQTAV